MASDPKGSWGEKFVKELISSLTSYVVVWHGDSNVGNANGDVFDMEINGYRTEVKTATSGVSNKTNELSETYQHENLYGENVWDKIVFLDVLPNSFYISVLSYDSMSGVLLNKHHHTGSKDCKVCDTRKQHPIFGRMATYHLNSWKFDTSRSVLNKGIDNGITIHIPITDNSISPSDEMLLKDFLTKHFEK
jgi:hypothetical protein